MSAPTLIKLNPPERERIYVYPDGSEVSIKNVTAFQVGKSGTHRLENSLGGKYIILPGFRYIILDVANWTV